MIRFVSFVFFFSHTRGLRIGTAVWTTGTGHQTLGGQLMKTKQKRNTIQQTNNTGNSVFLSGHLMPVISLHSYFVPLCDSLAGKHCTMFISWPLMVCCLLLGRWLTVGVWRDLAGKRAPGCGREQHRVRESRETKTTHKLDRRWRI